jgi:hypothetical protein
MLLRPRTDLPLMAGSLGCARNARPCRCAGAVDCVAGLGAWAMDRRGSARLGDRAEPGPWVELLSYRGSASVHSAVTAKMPPSLVIVPPKVMTRTLVRRSCPLVGSMTSRAGGSPG